MNPIKLKKNIFSLGIPQKHSASLCKNTQEFSFAFILAQITDEDKSPCQNVASSNIPCLMIFHCSKVQPYEAKSYHIVVVTTIVVLPNNNLPYAFFGIIICSLHIIIILVSLFWCPLQDKGNP